VLAIPLPPDSRRSRFNSPAFSNPAHVLLFCILEPFLYLWAFLFTPSVKRLPHHLRPRIPPLLSVVCASRPPLSSRNLFFPSRCPLMFSVGRSFIFQYFYYLSRPPQHFVCPLSCYYCPRRPFLLFHFECVCAILWVLFLRTRTLPHTGNPFHLVAASLKTIYHCGSLPPLADDPYRSPAIHKNRVYLVSVSPLPFLERYSV